MKKKILLTLLTLIFFGSQLISGDFNDPGFITDRDFFPIQLDWGLIGKTKLIDEKSDTVLALGLFLVQQKSAVFSTALIATHLQKNFGLQLNLFPIGAATEKNYGLSLGFENYSKKNYGVQMGLLNHSWAGKEMDPIHERLQVGGINIADTLYIGVVNDTDKFQIGLFNNGRRGAKFQIGLLNYNPCSIFPWMILFNFDMRTAPVSAPENSGTVPPR